MRNRQVPSGNYAPRRATKLVEVPVEELPVDEHDEAILCPACNEPIEHEAEECPSCGLALGWTEVETDDSGEPQGESDS